MSALGHKQTSGDCPGNVCFTGRCRLWYLAEVTAISTTSRDMHINLFQRFALMRYWRLTKGLPFNAFLSKDELHMNDWSYGCIAKLLARAIAGAATRVTVR